METRFGRNRIVPRTHPRIRCEYFIDPIPFYECSTSESERGIVRVSPRSRRTTRCRVAVGGKSDVGPVQAADTRRVFVSVSMRAPAWHSCTRLSSLWTPLIAETSRKGRGARVPSSVTRLAPDLLPSLSERLFLPSFPMRVASRDGFAKALTRKSRINPGELCASVLCNTTSSRSSVLGELRRERTSFPFFSFA